MLEDYFEEKNLNSSLKSNLYRYLIIILTNIKCINWKLRVILNIFWPFVIITLHRDGAGFVLKVKFDQY